MKFFKKKKKKKRKKSLNFSFLQKVLKRWDSQSVLRKVSEIGKRTVETIRHSKKSSVTLRAPKESRSTLRSAGMLGTWGGKSAKQAAASVAALSSHSSAGAGTSGASGAPARNTETQVFGMPLHVLMERQERLLKQASESASDEDQQKLRQLAVPLVVNKMVEHLMVRGVKEEGFLRLAASREETDNFKALMNSGSQVDFYKASVNAIGDLLKSFVREVPGSLFEASKLDRWLAIADLEAPQVRAQQCKNLLLELDHNNRAFITILFKLLKQVNFDFLFDCSVIQNVLFFKVVINKATNKMDGNNVARVLAPNILTAENDIASMTMIPKVATIVETLLSHHDFIFKELDVQYRVCICSSVCIFCFAESLLQLVNTIGTKRAASTRSKETTKKARATLRGAPAPPAAAPAPVEKPEPVAVKLAAEPAAAVAKQPALKKQKSEASSTAFARVKKEEPVAPMKRSKTELSLEASAVAAPIKKK